MVDDKPHNKLKRLGYWTPKELHYVSSNYQLSIFLPSCICTLTIGVMSDSEERTVNKNKAHRKDKRMFFRFVNYLGLIRLITAAWDTDDVDQ